MAKELIRLAGLSKYYTGNQSVVMGLNNLDLSFSRGEFVAITGESGSGKSTLSHVIGGILPYESGELFFNGNPTSHYDSADWERYRRDHISFISQNYGILPGATVQENVVSALLLTGMEKAEAQAATEKLLKQVELWEMRHRRAAKLSSGQKQRLSIARALAKPAPILIADEPTGNLDPENSAKIMQLLAQAAQERLVILVTHEFSEAENLATRHIVLQDGKVVMDAALRNPAEPAPMALRRSGEKSVSGYVARLQQRSRPVWSVFMALFFALTAFAVFAFLGTFIVHLDDSSTRIYDNSVFANSDKNRIVVAASDGSALTEEDYQTLANLAHVERVEPNGYVTDLQYAYREGVDFKFVSVESVSSGEGEVSVSTSVSVFSNAPYLQTIPVMPEGETFLTAGRLPENLYEVVAQGDASMIGQSFTVYLTNQKYWPSDQNLPINVTVVGVTDVGSNLYFHEDLGRLCIQIKLTASGGYFFLPAEDLEDSAFRCSESVISSAITLRSRDIRTMAQQHTLIAMDPVSLKTFDNINYTLGGEEDAPASLTLELEHEDYNSWSMKHIQDMKYLSYEAYSGDSLDYWTTAVTGNSATWIIANTVYDFVFYPVGDTALDESGNMTSGQYVVWFPDLALAVSTNVVSGASASDALFEKYETVPVTVADGELTGYSEGEIWNVEVLANGSVKATRPGSVDLDLDFWYISMGGDSVTPGGKFDVQFYPVGDTALDDFGNLTTGQYVIWSPNSNKALSSRLFADSTDMNQMFQAVSVTYENGVLSGYTEDEVWDIQVLTDGIVRISHDGVALKRSKNTVGIGGFDFNWLVEKNQKLTGYHDYAQKKLIEVSYNTFDTLTWDCGSEQASLTIADYGYTQRVIDAVKDLGYAALSPYQMGSLKQDADLAQQREQTLMICLLALCMVVALQIILLRAMFSAQTESYRLLSNIGLSAKMATRSILWQVLSFALVGQLLSFTALALCWNRGVEQIVHIIHYLPGGYIVLLIGVHLLVSLIAAMWVMRSLRKHVYALTGRESDLKMDMEEKEAVL